MIGLACFEIALVRHPVLLDHHRKFHVTLIVFSIIHIDLMLYLYLVEGRSRS